jgi:hypothetical protein
MDFVLGFIFSLMFTVVEVNIEYCTILLCNDCLERGLQLFF